MMNPTHQSESHEGGYVLLVVMILIMTMGIVGAAFFSVAGHEVRATQANLDSKQAFWLAEGAKERAMRHLSELPNPPDHDFYIYQDQAGPDGGDFTVHCLVDTSAMWEVEKAYVLDCVGNVGGIERRIRQRVRMTPFSLYAMFTDSEMFGPYQVWHITGDRIEGPLHTNGTLCIAGSPEFIGEVTTASDHMIGYQNYWIDDPGDWPVGGNNPHFEVGMELDSKFIPMPTETQDLRELGLYGGIYTSEETDLELGVSGDEPGVPTPGWLRYRESHPPGDWTSIPISGLMNKVFYCNEDIHIKGTLDGELTISSRRNIVVEDDLLYQGSDSQGAPLPGCDDLLGLVAEEDVIFADNSANQNDLVVDAVLMALDTSVKVENYASGPPRGVLTIWGGLIQKFRGPVGQFRYGSIIHGYQKDYHYDPRVTARTPPFFPQTGIYEETTWEETWDDSDPF